MTKLRHDRIEFRIPEEPKTSKMRDCLCPGCGYVFTHATSANPDNLSAVPTEGMVSLCAGCGAINIFERDLSVRAATKQEIAEIMSDQKLRKLVQSFQTFRAKNPFIKNPEAKQ